MISDITKNQLLAPYHHVSTRPSKNVRGNLLDAVNVWTNVPTSALLEVKSIVDMLHNASLLVDDIEDGSTLRRGRPVAHHVFGTPLTINCANNVYFMALHKCLVLPSLVLSSVDVRTDEMLSSFYSNVELPLLLVTIFTEELLRLHEGQGLDILWRDTLQCPSFDEYETMVRLKTGGLFRFSLRLMFALSPTSVPDEVSQRLFTIVERIGVFFQTLDDHQNICSKSYHLNKTFFEDISEGKFSYPVVHSVHEAAKKGDCRLLHVLRQRPTSMEMKKFAVELLEETGSLKATKLRIEQLKGEVDAHCCDLMPQAAPLMKCLSNLAATML